MLTRRVLSRTCPAGQSSPDLAAQPTHDAVCLRKLPVRGRQRRHL